MRVPGTSAGIVTTVTGAVDDVVEHAAELPLAIHGIDAVQGAKLLGDRATRLDTVERTFAAGRIVLGTSHPFAPADGSTGQLHVAQLRNGDAHALTADVVLKRAGAYHEAFAWRIARALGLEAFVPPAMMRAGGEVAIGRVAGETFDVAGITDAAGLRAALVAHHEVRGLAPAAAADAAERDHHLLAAFDWIVANRDRKLPNAMRAFDGTPAFIDNAGALRGEHVDPLVPRLKPDLYPVTPAAFGARQVVLPQSARDRIARGLTDDVLAEAHALLGPPTDEMRRIDRVVLARARTPHQLERLMLRRDHAVSNGVLEFTPVSNVTRAEDIREVKRLLLDTGGPLWPTAGAAGAVDGAAQVVAP